MTKTVAHDRGPRTSRVHVLRKILDYNALIIITIIALTAYAGWPILVQVSGLVIIMIGLLTCAAITLAIYMLYFKARMLHRDLVERIDNHNAAMFLLGDSTNLGPRRGYHLKEFQGLTFDSFPAQAVTKLIDQPQSSEVEVAKVDIMPILQTLDNVIFFGGRGRGKTTHMVRMMESRKGRGISYVFDTHSFPSKWPDATEVIGSETNVSEAERFDYMWERMLKLITLKNERLDQYRSGHIEEGCFRPDITVYIDELTHLPRKLKERGYDLTTFTSEIMTEGRKLNLNFIWGVHSDRAKALGLEGAKDLLECIDAQVYLRMSKETQERYAEIVWSDGSKDERKFLPAPPYPANGPVRSSPDVYETEPVIIDGVVVENILDSVKIEKPEPKGNAAEEEQIRLFLELQAKAQSEGTSLSWRKVTKAMFGAGCWGEAYMNKAERLFEKHGIQYDLPPRVVSE